MGDLAVERDFPFAMPDLRSVSTYRYLLTAVLIGLISFKSILQAASSVPTGGTFASGSGQINSSGNILNINQSTLRAIITWSTFSIAPGATVNFNNGSGATLNRVTGSAASTILGQLLATGNVFLINQQGILIGHGATVHTGGDFLASTLNLSNSAFDNGALLFTGSSKGAVVNLGDLSSSGGSIYLIGHAVQNGGSISAANGTTGLAAGSQILITDSATGQKVAVQAPGGDVTNSGFISAAQVELKSNGGNIYALAGNNGGQINATGTATQDGHVWLIATNGTANVAGLLTAANANGAGGSIETSGAHVNAGGAQITTGKGGSWLLDPDDLTIDSTLAGTIETSLNGGTNVTEQTTASGTGGSGDITVASNIAWSGSGSLTLSAYRNIGFNGGVVLTNTGPGNLTLRADNASTGVGTVNFSNAGQIDFSASTGSVSILYNPSGSYATPTDYTSNVLTNAFWSGPLNGSVTSQLTAYMLVNSIANLQSLDTNDAGTYALGKDLDISSVSNFTPLGNTTPYFTGIFDGQGHTITGLTINDSTGANLGLFSTLGTNGQVRNLNLTNVSVTETGSSTTTIGAIAAVNSGTISNVSVAGTITSGSNLYCGGGVVGCNSGIVQNASAAINMDASAATNTAGVGGLVGISNTGSAITGSSTSGSVSAPAANAAYVGGLIGFNSATVSNSSSSATVTGGTNANVGGLIGANTFTVSNSYATGAVSGLSGSEIGGLLGDNSTAGAATVSSSYATGNITGTANYAGGLVGYNRTLSPITGSYATGNVTDTGASIGGLAGWSDSNITNSFATGAVVATSSGTYAGGLVGFSTADISNSHASGPVSSTSSGAYLGGLVGLSNGLAITDSYATGSVTGVDSSFIGGLVGASASAVSGSYASGAVTGTTSTNAGGLIGYTTTGGTVTSSYATGAVAGGASSSTGGLVGSSGDTVTTSYALGNVTAGDGSYAGGLVGSQNGDISDTYAHGSVAGSLVGGLVGNIVSGTLSTSYASGPVTLVGAGSAGAVVGSNTQSINTVFWDNQVTSLPGVGANTGTVSAATGLPTAQFQSGNMPSGLNANSVWTAPAGTYPYFIWQGAPVTISGTAYNGLSPIASAGVGVLSGGYLLASLTANASGFYSVVEPNNMVNSSGVLSYLTSGGVANTFSDGASGYTSMDLHTGTLSLLSGNNSTLSALNSALGIALGSNSGSAYLFTSPANTLSLTPGTALSLSAGNFNLDQPITGAGNILISSSGNLSIANSAGLTAASGSNINLAVGGAFTNSAGANALNVSGGGQWLVYSQNPANDLTGGLAPSFFQYNATYGVTSPAQAGNGLLYSLAPVITASLIGSISKVYDGTSTATLTPGNFSSTGAIQGDNISFTAGSASYVNQNVNSGIQVIASNLSLTASNGGIPVYGYQLLSSSANGNIGSITPATLTYTANATSLTTGTTFPIFTGSVTGFVNNQTLASATTGTAIFTSPATSSSSPGSYAINGSGLTSNQGNYIFTQAVSNSSALTLTAPAAPTPTPPPTPTPTPSPTPTPTPTATPVTIIVKNTAAVDTQTLPTFTAAIPGSVSGLNTAAVLAGLTFQITPSLSGPGTYLVTAIGTAPAGYTFNILPGTFTVIDSSPTTLPTESRPFNPEVPGLLVMPEVESENYLLTPFNAMGQFTISASNSGLAGVVSQQPPVAESSFFSEANGKRATYAVGVRP